MKFNRLPEQLLIILFMIALLSCNEDDCTKMINIPQWDPNQMTFVDNMQEVPCDFEEPVDEPVN